MVLKVDNVDEKSTMDSEIMLLSKWQNLLYL